MNVPDGPYGTGPALIYQSGDWTPALVNEPGLYGPKEPEWPDVELACRQANATQSSPVCDFESAVADLQAADSIAMAYGRAVERRHEPEMS